MPRGFTDQEVRAVAEKLVRSAIRRPHDPLGVRRTDVTFNDVRESAAGVFLLNPKAPLAVAELARQRLLSRTAEVTALTAAMTKALAVLRRRVLPVKDLSALSNARSALIELEGSVRSGAPRDVTLVPGYVRFDKNLRRFLEKAGGNVRGAGELVPTPSEARSSLRRDVGLLRDLGEKLTALALQLAAAMDEYGALGLPQIVSGNVVASARGMLSARVDDLEGRSESGRLDVLKDTVLELLAMRGVVKKFGSFRAPEDAYDLSGQGSLFADASRPRVAPALAADNTGPYALVPGTTLDNSRNTLRAWLEGANPAGAPSVTLFLPSSFVPMVQGTAPSPYNINSGTNGFLRFVVAGVPYEVEFDAGPSMTANDIAGNLTSGLVGSGFKGEAYFSPLYFDGEALVAGNVLTPVVGTFPANSVDTGYEVDFYLGANAGVTRTVTAVGGTLAAPTSITVSGGALAAGPNQRVRWGTAARKVRVVPTNPTLAVQNRVRIDLAPLTEVHRQAGVTLGMIGPLFSQGAPTDAATVATFINQANTGLAAEAYLHEPIAHHFRTDPLDGTRLIAYEHYGQASWTAGTTVTVTFGDPLDAGIGLGMALVLRGGANPNAIGTVLSRVSDTVLTASFGSAVQASSGVAEVGSASFVPGQVVRITSGPLAGDYNVEGFGSPVDFECTVREFLPVFRTATTEPVFAEGLQGAQGLRFLSRDATMQAAVEVVDPLLVFFDQASTNKATAKTRYVKLPEVPPALEEGDVLEHYASSYEVPTQALPITRVFADAVVELDGLLTAPLSVLFGASLAPPFFRLRASRVADFGAFSRALVAWAGPWTDGGVARFFKNFQRLLNPLLVNENPTDSQVGAAEQSLEEFAGAFAGEADSLASALAGYAGPESDEVTALFRALREKGADRAVDLLLECRFKDFFGLDQETVSYAGAMQKAVRDVAMMDLPVRRTNRAQGGQSQLLSSAEGTDFEYSSDDLDDTEIPDPTIDFG